MIILIIIIVCSTLKVTVSAPPALDFTLKSTNLLHHHTYYMHIAKCPFVHYQQLGMEATRTHIPTD